MRSFFIVAALTSVTLLGSQAFAQTEDVAPASPAAGAAIVYGTELERLGLQLGAVFPADQILPKLRFAADLALYLPRSETGASSQFFELDANAHYLFFRQALPQVFQAYGVAGLNFAIARTTIDALDSSDTATELGINVGVGAELGLGFGSAFVEFKYVLSDADQGVLGAGLRIPLGG